MGPPRLDETVKSILSNSFPKEQGHLIQAASMEILQAVGGSNGNTSSLEEALRALQSRSVKQDGSREKPLGSSEGSQKSATKAPSTDKFAQILASITKHTSSPAHEPKSIQASVASMPHSRPINDIRLDRPKSKIAGSGFTGPFLKTPLEEDKLSPSPNVSLDLENRDSKPLVNIPNSGTALSSMLTQLEEHKNKATGKPEAHVQFAAQARTGPEARKDLQHGEQRPEIPDEKHSTPKQTTQTKQAKLSKLNDTIALASASASTTTSARTGTSVSVSVSVREGSKLKRCPTRWTPEQDEMLRTAVRIHGPRNWKVLASMVEGRDHVQCLQRWNKVLQPGLVKGPWTSGEDELLTMLAERYGNHWTSVAAQIPGRTAKQCRERWRLNLDPSINHNPFSFEEDALLLKLHGSLGSRWAEIKMYFTGRTENAVKTRFKSLMRSRARAWPSSDEGLLLKLHAQYGNDWEKIRECGNWKSADFVKKKIKRVLAMPYEYPNARERNKKAPTGGNRNGAQQVIQDQSSSSRSADSCDTRTVGNMINLQAAQAPQEPPALNRKRLSSSPGLLSPQNFVTIDASSNGGTLSPMGVAVNVKAPTTLSQANEENPSKRLKRLISARQLLDSRVSNLVSPVDSALLLNSNEKDAPASRTLSGTSKPWLASGLAGLGQQFHSVNQGVPALGNLAFHHFQQHPQHQYQHQHQHWHYHQHQQYQQEKQQQQENLHQRNILAMAAFQAPGQYSQDSLIGGRKPSDLVSQSKVLQEFSRQANEHRLAVCGSELLRASRSFLGPSNVDLSTLTPGDINPALAQLPTSQAFQLLYGNVATEAATGSGVPPTRDLAGLDIRDVIQSQGFAAPKARR